MQTLADIPPRQQHQALGVSTFAFTVCFAVWTIFSIIGIRIKQDLGLTDTEFGILVATPILTGSLSRIFLGIWTDQYGGRIVYTLLMAATAVAAWMLSTVSTYPMFLLAALGVGLAGGSFAVGIAFVSRWYDRDRQGTALGMFGIGTAGAAVTNFGAPFLLLAFGWERAARIYAVVLLVTAVLFLVATKEDPVTAARKAAARSPVWRLAMDWRVAFPLHPEFRTLPMVWYVPPLSPLQSAAEAGMIEMDGAVPDVRSLRIPVRYLANLLTAGEEEPVVRALERMLAMRAYMRSKTVDEAAGEEIASRVGLTAAEIEDRYRLMALARYEDRFVIPTTHREAAEDAYDLQGSCGFSFGNESSGGSSRPNLFGGPRRRSVTVRTPTEFIR